MAANTLADIFNVLRRRPDVEAPNLQAWDATDRLLLETAVQLGRAGGTVAVINDRYGALTLGASAVLAPASLRVHQDLITGERALRLNAAELGDGPGAEFVQLPLGHQLLAGADTILLQLPKTLAELEEIAAAVALHAAPDVRLLAGGRVKHMSLGMNAVLERYFVSVQPQLARQKSRVLLAAGPKPSTAAPRFPVVEHLAGLDLDVAAHGAVFAGPRLDIGTRFLLAFLPRMKPARHAVDLGCGTGILAAMYARQFPAAAVTATDQSAAAVQSALATARANGMADRISVLQDDALSTFPDAAVDTVLLNPPFHVGAGVHAGAGLKMIQAAGRVLAPGGELWTVFNRHLAYLPALERYVGPTVVEGRNPKFTVTRSTRRPL
ncbi:MULTISPECIES: class I SAM-dependent methyltransferase [unclassified Arthrobacter]|uniref:class I SAM-dependent methyltransferase n=1 Tax=unclassified Arthrobacter TaxID=235627 RepID=UPI00037A3B2F|nr:MULTISPECIES: class I SAM-dependent methyltransferase [unclassified Arthrobacter]BCW54879.1 ribosomal RNA large subunit methyltransferase G [Arthrobacter sp. StoSoilB19]